MSKRENKEKPAPNEGIEECVPVGEEVVSTEETGSDGELNAEEEAESETSPEDSGATVISKGKASLIISGAEEVRSEASQPKPLLVEPRVVAATSQNAEDEDSEPEGEELEEIERLERKSNPGKERIKVDKAKFEKREARLDEAERQEQEWGNAVSPGWWIAIVGASVVVLILGGVLVKSWYDGDEVEAVSPSQAERVPLSDPHEGSPEQWFHQRAGRIASLATTVLEGYATANTEVERSQWVRFPTEFIAKSKQRKGLFQPRADQIDHETWAVDHTQETAFLTMKCQDANFMPFRAYFVREGDQLKLDWNATTAWCEADLATIKKELTKRRMRVDEINKRADATAEDATREYPEVLYEDPVLVRCLIRRRDEFYAGPYNDVEHSAYMITSADKVHYMWAYVKRDSTLDLDLRRLLNHGRFVVDLKKDIRVTLRVKGGEKDALPSQLELVELVHPEWVTP